jgi:hypothetical protein
MAFAKSSRYAVVLLNLTFFMDKTIQYLASSSSKKALVVVMKVFYNSGDAIEITAIFQ